MMQQLSSNSKDISTWNVLQSHSHMLPACMVKRRRARLNLFLAAVQSVPLDFPNTTLQVIWAHIISFPHSPFRQQLCRLQQGNACNGRAPAEPHTTLLWQGQQQLSVREFALCHVLGAVRWWGCAAAPSARDLSGTVNAGQITEAGDFNYL